MKNKEWVSIFYFKNSGSQNNTTILTALKKLRGNDELDKNNLK